MIREKEGTAGGGELMKGRISPLYGLPEERYVIETFIQQPKLMLACL